MCNVLFCLFCTHFNCCLFHYLVLTSQWERLFPKRCVVLCTIKHEFIYHCADVSFCFILLANLLHYGYYSLICICLTIIQLYSFSCSVQLMGLMLKSQITTRTSNPTLVHMSSHTNMSGSKLSTVHTNLGWKSNQELLHIYA